MMGPGCHGIHVAGAFPAVETREADLFLARQAGAEVAFFLAAVRGHRTRPLLELPSMFEFGNDDGLHVDLCGLGAAAYASTAAGLS